jgi:phenylacetic acid degradation protein
MPCYSFQGLTPVVDPSSFVHPLACLIGDVHVGPECYIAPFASLRADFGRIVIEGESSIQDQVTIHTSSLHDTIVRRGATIAHGAVLHGCEVGENVLVGMNCVILDGAVLGEECLIAANSCVSADRRTEPRTLLAGNPAKPLRVFAPDEVTWKTAPDAAYRRLVRDALESLVEVEPLAAAEPDRPRLESDALAVRLSGDVARQRQARAKAGQGPD